MARLKIADTKAKLTVHLTLVVSFPFTLPSFETLLILPGITHNSNNFYKLSVENV